MNRRSFPTRTLIAACATAAALAAPAVASATDRWVDTDTGTNSGNSCTVQANPCKTIQQASDTSQIAGNFGTIHVDQGTYTEDINIAQGNHVTADDFVTGDSGPTVITNTGSGVTVYVQATASISGFQIVSDSPFVVVAADQLVSTLAAKQLVVAAFALQHVAVLAAAQEIGALAAQKLVLTVVSEQRVGTAAADDQDFLEFHELLSLALFYCAGWMVPSRRVSDCGFPSNIAPYTTALAMPFLT